ncbi:MAG: NHLP bacteriocin export ABC transporter permease/ATPase subunit [Chloroflexota bacterium]
MMTTNRSPQEKVDAWLRFIRELGYNPELVVHSGSNNPFLLDGRDKAWIVFSGKVDVFAVQVKDGQPVSARRHLFRAEPGSLLLGMDLASYRRDIGLLAVGVAGTRLIRIERSRLEDVAHSNEFAPDLINLINGWVSGLSAGLGHNLRAPRQFEPLEAGKESALGDGSVAHPRKGILWVCSPRGIARFMGWEELPLLGDDDFLPISEDTWLESVGENTLYGMDTAAFLKQPFAWVCLENFHRMTLDLIAWNVEQEQRQERERLNVRETFDRTYVESAISYLTSILRPKSRATFVPDYGEEPLVTACRMVGNAIGIPVRPRPDPVDGKAEAQTLDGIAIASRIRTRQVVLRGDWWKQDNGPLLAYLEAEKRPVAVLPYLTNQYELYDPVERTHILITQEVALRLVPFAHAFYRPFPERKLSGRDVLQFGLHGSGRDLWTVLLMGVAGGILGIIPPLAIGRIFDTIIPERESRQLLILAAILIIGALAGALFQITRSIAVLRIESKLDSSVQAAVWDRLLKLPAPFFREYTAGDLASRALGISTIRQAISGTIVLTILSGVFSIFNFILLFFIDGQLALLASVLVLVAVGVTTLAGVLQARNQRALTNLQGKISGLVLQIITGISKLRIAGVENRVFAFWAREFGAQRILTYRTRRIANGLAVFTSAYTVIALLVIFMAVAFSGETSRLTTGNFVTFIAAFGLFLFTGLQLSAAFISLLRLVPVYERAQPILHTLPEVNAFKADPGELTGEIEISRVTFRYKDKGPTVLNDVSLHFKHGEFVALVGPSGSGKSTLLRLLLGFETPEAGGVFYDDQNLNSLDLRAVRKQLGVVLQNSHLISGDLFTNIVGQSRLTMDDAWEAARLAGLDEDVRQMPMGMHTFVSSGGSTLSGGQRQRLLIARAIAHRPRILLFDEATSALDNQTQAVVSSSLSQLDSTRIVIAHRLSTIISADRIVVLDKGRIVQEGTYNELMQVRDGLFAELARRQLV